MSQDKIKQIHRWYGWVLGAIMTVLGILLVLSCLDIYTSGPRPYSAEAIALRFRRIVIPVIISFIGVVGGIALNLLLPLEHARAKGASSPEGIMLRLRRTANIPPVRKEIRTRSTLRAVTAFCFSALMIYPIVYFTNPAHFSVAELNADVIRAVIIALIPALIGLVLCWVCRTLVNRSFQREASIYKKALAAGQHTTDKEIDNTPTHRSALSLIRIAIVAIAVIFVVVGIFNGGAEDVLKKAIAICTECIGLG